MEIILHIIGIVVLGAIAGFALFFLGCCIGAVVEVIRATVRGWR